MQFRGLYLLQFLMATMNKGNVYYFNPTCELAVSNGSFSYMPPQLLSTMENDLALLPMVFCHSNDIVLTRNQLSVSFRNYLLNLGMELPELWSLKDLEADQERYFDSIKPWGWSPAAHYQLRKLKDRCSNDFQSSQIFNWRHSYRNLYERSTSLQFLHQVLNDHPSKWFIDRSATGYLVYNVAEIELLLKKNTGIVVKAPISSSGRGIQIIRKQTLHEPQRQWITGVLKLKNYLVAEPLLEKPIQFTFPFEISLSFPLNNFLLKAEIWSINNFPSI